MLDEMVTKVRDWTRLKSVQDKHCCQIVILCLSQGLWFPPRPGFCSGG